MYYNHHHCPDIINPNLVPKGKKIAGISRLNSFLNKKKQPIPPKKTGIYTPNGNVDDGREIGAKGREMMEKGEMK